MTEAKPELEILGVVLDERERRYLEEAGTPPPPQPQVYAEALRRWGFECLHHESGDKQKLTGRVPPEKMVTWMQCVRALIDPSFSPKTEVYERHLIIGGSHRRAWVCVCAGADADAKAFAHALLQLPMPETLTESAAIASAGPRMANLHIAPTRAGVFAPRA